MPCTRHRVFLATLIVAAKYLNDSSPKNKHWTRYAHYFDNGEVNFMERQLLGILDFDLRFSEEDAIDEWAHFMPRRTSSPRQDRETRQSAINRLKRRSRTDLEMEMPITPPYDAVPPSLSGQFKEQQSSTSSSGFSDVPLQAQVPHPSPISSGSSPLADMSMSRCTTTASDLSMDSLMDDTGSSGSGSECELDSENHNVLIIPDKASKTELRNASRISFALPSRPPTARSANRASSYSMGQSWSSVSHSRSSTSQQSMSTASSVPRIRDSVSGGFLSRVFGSSASTKEKLNRLERSDSNGSSKVGVSGGPGSAGNGDVLIASQSTSMDGSHIKDFRIRHPKQYMALEGEADYGSI